MGSLNMLMVVVGVLLVFACASSNSQCPPKHKVYDSKPICHSDADCQKYGKICCPNQFNTKSCTYRAPYSIWNRGSGYNNRGGGGNCNGEKCSPWEVCKPDHITKRLRCQRTGSHHRH